MDIVSKLSFQKRCNILIHKISQCTKWVSPNGTHVHGHSNFYLDCTVHIFCCTGQPKGIQIHGLFVVCLLCVFESFQAVTPVQNGFVLVLSYTSNLNTCVLSTHSPEIRFDLVLFYFIYLFSKVHK